MKLEEWAKGKQRELARAYQDARWDDVRALLITIICVFVRRHSRVYADKAVNALADEVWNDFHFYFPYIGPTKAVLSQLLLEALELMEYDGELACRRIEWLGIIYSIYRFNPEMGGPVGGRPQETVGRTIMPMIHITGEPKALAAFEQALCLLLQRPGLDTADAFLEAAAHVQPCEIEPKSRPIKRSSRRGEDV